VSSLWFVYLSVLITYSCVLIMQVDFWGIFPNLLVLVFVVVDLWSNHLTTPPTTLDNR
jgi:hypothetical protein